MPPEPLCPTTEAAIRAAVHQLDPIGIDRFLLDVAVASTGSLVGELWTHSIRKGTCRFCTHPFEEGGTFVDWLLSLGDPDCDEFCRKWTAPFQSPIAPQEDHDTLAMSATAKQTLLWHSTSSIKAVVVFDCSAESAKRIMWLGFSDQNKAREARDHLESLMTVFRHQDTPPSQGTLDTDGEALRRALCHLRKGLVAKLDEVLTTDNPFNIVFLVRTDSTPPGMSFRFDTDQVNLLQAHCPDPTWLREVMAALGRDFDPSEVFEDVPLSRVFGMEGEGRVAKYLERVIYRGQFSGHVMQLGQSAKFEFWKSMIRDFPEKYPREEEGEDLEMALALRMIKELVLKPEHLYHIPLHGLRPRRGRDQDLADLVVAIACDKLLGPDEWLRAQCVVKEHAPFLSLASQYDEIRHQADIYEREQFAHDWIKRLKRMRANLPKLKDSSKWREYGSTLFESVVWLERDCLRLLGASEPQSLADVVQGAWERAIDELGLTDRVTLQAKLSDVRLVPADVRALRMVMESLLKNALVASVSNKIDEALLDDAAQSLEQCSPSIAYRELRPLLEQVGFFDKERRSVVVCAFKDEQAEGLVIINVGPRRLESEAPVCPCCEREWHDASQQGDAELQASAIPERKLRPATVVPEWGLRISTNYLADHDWTLDCWYSGTGLWLTHIYRRRRANG